MSKTFIYLDTEEKKINDNTFFCIYLLEFSKKVVFKVYKIKNQNTKDLENKLSSIKPFENVSNKIDYVIKSDGKVAIDINL